MATAELTRGQARRKNDSVGDGAQIVLRWLVAQIVLDSLLYTVAELDSLCINGHATGTALLPPPRPWVSHAAFY
jgi:hypothetical protein